LPHAGISDPLELSRGEPAFRGRAAIPILSFMRSRFLGGGSAEAQAGRQWV